MTPLASSSNSVAAHDPACGWGTAVALVMTKWSTMTTGDGLREKSVCRNGRSVQASPADWSGPATTLLRWIVKKCCLMEEWR